MSNSYKFYSDTKDIMKKYVNATEGAIIYGISKSRIMVLASEAGVLSVGRAERRRLEKQKGKQVKTYNLTRSQLHNAVRQVTEEDLKRIKQEAMEDAINTAMTLLLVLPMEVLMDHYWKKTYAKKIPEFTELVLQYYERWQNGELDMDEMKRDLWEYGGVRLEEREAE